MLHEHLLAFVVFLVAWSQLCLFMRWLWWLAHGCSCCLCFLGVWNIKKCQQYGNALCRMLLLFEPAMAPLHSAIFTDCPMAPAALVSYWVMTPWRGCRLWICWRWGGHLREFMRLKAKWPPFSLLSDFFLQDLLFCFLSVFSIVIVNISYIVI